ncbi:hypothetical protein HMPREF0262_00684 [Clostridium sp. ATCC 29733]|nr:hypothetical protein HMPREF0262_00684 [Clostridium sp. ATCC 29733]
MPPRRKRGRRHSPLAAPPPHLYSRRLPLNRGGFSILNQSSSAGR